MKAITFPSLVLVLFVALSCKKNEPSPTGNPNQNSVLEEQVLKGIGVLYPKIPITGFVLTNKTGQLLESDVMAFEKNLNKFEPIVTQGVTIMRGSVFTQGTSGLFWSVGFETPTTAFAVAWKIVNGVVDRPDEQNRVFFLTWEKK